MFTCVHYGDKTEYRALEIFGVITSWFGCASCEAVLNDAGIFLDPNDETLAVSFA